MRSKSKKILDWCLFFKLKIIIKILDFQVVKMYQGVSYVSQTVYRLPDKRNDVFLNL